MADPVVPADVNAASFDSAHDDVFSRIAARYDFLCDLFSLCIHRRWKTRMARRILATPWKQMLDVAAGTGHIALRVVRQLDAKDGRSCIVSDICPAMLEVAKRRAGPLADAVDFRILDAHRLTPIASASRCVIIARKPPARLKLVSGAVHRDRRHRSRPASVECL